MERESECDQSCDHLDKVQNIDTVPDTKTVQDMFKIMLENMSEMKKKQNSENMISENNQNLTDFKGYMEKELSENNQKISDWLGKLQTTLSDWQESLENKLDKTNQKLSDNNKELKNYVSEVRAEMKADNERLAKKFEIENQNLKKEFL
jgi:hypothetical protein